MSTTIYYGLKILDESLFLQELIDYKLKIINSYSEKELASVYLRSFFIKNNLFKTKNITTRVSDFNDQFELDFDKNKTQRLIGYNNPYDLSINYFKTEKLAIPYFENDELYHGLLNFKSVQEYAYYNNVDQPESVTEEEWNNRKKLWESAVSQYRLYFGYPNAISIEINKEKFLPYSEEFISAISENFDAVLLGYLKRQVKDNAIELFSNDNQKDILENKFNGSFLKLMKFNNELYIKNHGDVYANNLIKEYSFVKKELLG